VTRRFYNAEHFRSFRKRLLRRVVEHEGELLRRIYQLEGDACIATMAETTGLSAEFLREAIALARMAHANEKPDLGYHFLLRSPVPIRPHIAAVIKKLGFAPGEYSGFYRSLFHAAMQTTFEPNRRGFGLGRAVQGKNKNKPYNPRYKPNYNPRLVSIEPHPKARRIKPLTVTEEITRKHSLKALTDIQNVYMNEPLREALGLRAKGYGTVVMTYCLYWILDAIDGLLPRTLVIQPVAVRDLFPRAENYVLPARKPLPDALLDDSETK
jgi:hypothetical protein